MCALHETIRHHQQRLIKSIAVIRYKFPASPPSLWSAMLIIIPVANSSVHCIWFQYLQHSKFKGNERHPLFSHFTPKNRVGGFSKRQSRHHKNRKRNFQRKDTHKTCYDKRGKKIDRRRYQHALG